MCFCVFSVAHHFNIVRIAVAAFDFPIRNHLQKPQGATVAASQILYAQQVCLMLNKESLSRIAPLCNGVFKTFDNAFVVRNIPRLLHDASFVLEMLCLSSSLAFHPWIFSSAPTQLAPNSLSWQPKTQESIWRLRFAPVIAHQPDTQM